MFRIMSNTIYSTYKGYKEEKYFFIQKNDWMFRFMSNTIYSTYKGYKEEKYFFIQKNWLDVPIYEQYYIFNL